MHIWDVCSSVNYELFKSFHPVLNFGIERNSDMENNTPVKFGLIGFYYMITDDIEVSAGYERDLNKKNNCYTGTVGFTIRL